MFAGPVPHASLFARCEKEARNECIGRVEGGQVVRSTRRSFLFINSELMRQAHGPGSAYAYAVRHKTINICLNDGWCHCQERRVLPYQVLSPRHNVPRLFWKSNGSCAQAEWWLALMTRKQRWSCFRVVSKWKVVGEEGSFSLVIED